MIHYGTTLMCYLTVSRLLISLSLLESCQKFNAFETDVVGLPSKDAKRIAFEELIMGINISRLQEVVDKGLCLILPLLLDRKGIEHLKLDKFSAGQ